MTISNMDYIDERGVYTDLIKELASRHINVYVVSPREKRSNLSTELVVIDNIRILKVQTGNLTSNRSFFEKGISTLLFEHQYLIAIKKYYSDVQFDMVIYSTPPITMGKIVKYIEKKHNCKSYLILKDIFPQNAVDIGLLREGSIVWRYFRSKEKKLYEMSDMIGCMSQGNVDYLLKHNKEINKSKVEIFPNSINPIARMNSTVKNKEMLKKYNIPEDSTVFVYGGNLGKPQGIDFILEVIENFASVENAFLMIVGNGAEYTRLSNYINNNRFKNLCLIDKLPKIEYDQLLEVADVGLIFLDRRFTIPNFPSRLTAYMEYSLPVLAATDKNTDLKDVIEQSGSGLWSESGDIKSFINNARKLSSDAELREQMGVSGRKFLEDNYDISNTVNIIIKHL
jgi:glycosyltransferase involved in cell wall biosynthesis